MPLVCGNTPAVTCGYGSFRTFALRAATHEWRNLYRRRSAAEREFGRLKHEFGLAHLRVRSLAKVRLHADLCILSRLALAYNARGSVRADSGLTVPVSRVLPVATPRLSGRATLQRRRAPT